MTNFDMNAFIESADAASKPTGSYGLVYETWQNERSNNAFALIRSDVPPALQDHAEVALREKGIIQDAYEPEDGTCGHGLDEMNCPGGCFER